MGVHRIGHTGQGTQRALQRVHEHLQHIEHIRWNTRYGTQIGCKMQPGLGITHRILKCQRSTTTSLQWIVDVEVIGRRRHRDFCLR